MNRQRALKGIFVSEGAHLIMANEKVTNVKTAQREDARKIEKRRKQLNGRSMKKCLLKLVRPLYHVINELACGRQRGSIVKFKQVGRWKGGGCIRIRCHGRHSRRLGKHVRRGQPRWSRVNRCSPGEHWRCSSVHRRRALHAVGLDLGLKSEKSTKPG